MIFPAFLAKSITKQHTTRTVLDTYPLHLFRIIQDVDQYSEFLPLCTYSDVSYREPSGRVFHGTLRVGYPPWFSEEYVSKVTVVPEDWIIRTETIQSNYIKSLNSQWQLSPVPDHEDKCQIYFRVEMTVTDPVVASVLDQVLEQVGVRQVEAFAKRCKEVPVPFDLIEQAKQYPLSPSTTPSTTTATAAATTMNAPKQ